MTVVVLMSTYDGMRFLPEQIASILPQLGPADRLVVRDDGSRDGSPDYLESLGDPRITLRQGRNLGPAGSFMTLLFDETDDAETVFFADQDDVWFPDKIARARRALASAGDEAVLYCSRATLTDATLRPLGASLDWSPPYPLNQRLVCNIVTGCTAAMNRRALEAVKATPPVGPVYLHDWWIYLAIAREGRVIFDSEPTMLYRQHGGNSVGMRLGFAARMLNGFRQLERKHWMSAVWEQARTYFATFPPVSAHELEVMRCFGAGASPRTLFSASMFPGRWTMPGGHEILFRCALLYEALRNRPVIQPPLAR